MLRNNCAIAIGIVTLLLTALAGSGCGGDDSAEASLPKKEFLKRAKAICAGAEKEQVKIAIAYTKHHPNAQEEDLIEPAGLPPLEKQLEKLTVLGLPSGGAAEVEAFLDEFETALEQGKEDPASLLRSKENPFNQANKLAKEYGIKGCEGAP